jgi:hypothetical protein
MAKWVQRVFAPPGPRKKPDPAFTLDQDGGLVVSLAAVVKSKGMKQQLQAVRLLRARQKGTIKEKVLEPTSSD